MLAPLSTDDTYFFMKLFVHLVNCWKVTVLHSQKASYVCVLIMLLHKALRWRNDALKKNWYEVLKQWNFTGSKALQNRHTGTHRKISTRFRSFQKHSLKKSSWYFMLIDVHSARPEGMMANVQQSTSWS